MNEIDLIKAAREILAAGHWHKGQLTDYNGNYCIYGALQKADSESVLSQETIDRETAAADALMAHVPDAWRWHNYALTGYNDDPDTTLQDMLNLIDKTLADKGAL